MAKRKNGDLRLEELLVGAPVPVTEMTPFKLITAALVVLVRKRSLESYHNIRQEI